MRRELILLVLMSVGVCCADTITVNWDGSADYTTIQQAINAAVDGDEVIVADGTYTGFGNRDIDFSGKAITVRSENGPENCIIDCQGTKDDKHRGFYFGNDEDNNSVLDGITIVNGYAYPFGGAIYCYASSPSIINCVVRNNKSSYGAGGIASYRNSSSPLIKNCIVSNNSADFAGGIYCYESNATIVDCTISSNSGDEEAGGIDCSQSSNPLIINCLITKNNSKFGGGIRCDNSNPVIRECVINENTAIFRGGGILCYSNSNATINECEISNNKAMQGGGINCGSCSPIISNSIIKDNTGTLGGGVLGSSCNNLTIINCDISSNEASQGGGFFFRNNRSSTITDCVISNNKTSEYGGGIFCYYYSSTVMTNCLISANTALLRGGGISSTYNSSTTFRSCMIEDNISGSGGGISNDRGSLIMSNSIIRNNNADSFGGGLFCSGGDSNLMNCSVLCNSAMNGQALGCVSAVNGAVSNIQITNCILWNYGDEIWNNDGSSILINYSNIFGGWEGIGNINVDPMFAFESDAHLLEGSPCIDAGTNYSDGELIVDDYDGTYRPLDGDRDGQATFDIGAYEFHPKQACIALSASNIEFFIQEGATNTLEKKLLICNAGGKVLHWGVAENCDWLQVEPSFGTLNSEIDEIALKVNGEALSHGYYKCDVLITDEDALNNPKTVRVNLYINKKLYVPDEYPTIQSAIDSANPKRDIVIVADGTYTGEENRDIDFLGKAITVKSANGAKNCVINCEGTKDEPHRGFNFYNYETNDSILEGFTITNGYSTSGGGINCSFSRPKIADCIIKSNGARYGGGITCARSRPNIISCIISKNTADCGGGIHFTNQSGPTITNCVISSNNAIYTGGGISCYYSSSPIIKNCTLSFNNAENGNSLICNSGLPAQPSNVIISNCILWSGGDEIWNNDESIISITYSDIFGGWQGQRNIDTDPLFVSQGFWDDNETPDDEWDDFWVEGDYHLQESSPCIDSGDPNHPINLSETDIDGYPRVMDGNADGIPKIDMGAYEHPVPVKVNITPSVLNAYSNGQFVIAYLILPQVLGLNLEDIENVLLQDRVEAVEVLFNTEEDFNLTVKFDRSAVNDFLIEEGLTGEVEFEMTIELDDGTILMGLDIIRIINEF